MIYRKVKRIADVAFSLAGMAVLSPLLLLVAAAIKLDSRGPVIFKQDRLGQGGEVFKLYKFRSMQVGAEKMGSGHYSFSGDPRVTRVGRIIRATSIDELPQFLNIIKGDMSIVGPRPTLTYHPCRYEEYSQEQKRRFDVRPGVTGWAQVNGRKQVLWDRRIKYDVEYVDNMSLWFDMKILVKTVFKVLAMKDNVNTGKTID